MNDGDGSWIVHNGEVYNYRELRHELSSLGHEFRSDCDTEVILKSYTEYGTECVEKFRGMFSFAIWDESKQELFAARDPLGIKPYYYSLSDGSLSFGSEIKALLGSGLISPVLDTNGIEGFLTLGYVPAPDTTIEGVKSLPPGTSLRFDPESGHLNLAKYWEPSFEDTNHELDSEEIRSALLESVRFRLRSDVPVGAFLSGGLDSSTVVSLMRDANGDSDNLHTYSIGFGEMEYSETDYASKVAEYLETTHSNHEVTADDVRDQLPTIIEAMDQPSVDGVNTYFVSRSTAGDGIKVALSGLGGDELFYGYSGPFETVPKIYRLFSKAAMLPSPVTSASSKILGLLGSATSSNKLLVAAEVMGSDARFGSSYLAVRGLYTPREGAKLLGNDGPSTDLAGRIEESVESTLSGCAVEEAVSHAELTWYMHNQLLRDTDVMSMENSLEVRVPFLDQEFVSLITSLPSSEKKPTGLGEKGILKEAMWNDLPDLVLNREKSTFTFPFDDWLRDELKPIVEEALSKDMIKETPLDYDAVQEIKDRYYSGEQGWQQLWMLVVLSLWVDHLKKDTRPT